MKSWWKCTTCMNSFMEFEPVQSCPKQVGGCGKKADATRFRLLEIDEKGNKVATEPPVFSRSVREYVAGEVREKLQILTTKDNAEMYYYKDGIYHKDPVRSVITEAIRETFQSLQAENMVNRISTHEVNEILLLIRADSYIDRDEMDNDKNLICMSNGVYNLATGILVPHNYRFRMTVKISVDYNPEAGCPLFDTFLEQVARPEDIPTINEMIGYCLYRTYKYQCAVMLIGGGENGKSVLINTIGALLGGENVAHKSLQELEKNRFAKVGLEDKLANLCADLDAEGMKSTGTFKQLTGGDTLSAEEKFKVSHNFKNYAKLIFSANTVPPVTDETHAFYRRWIFFEFLNTFDDSKKDPELTAKLTTPSELSGIFNRAVEGLARLRANDKFSYSKSTEAVRELYVKMSNPLKGFLDEKVDDEPNGYIIKEDLYAAFVGWCIDNKLPTISKQAMMKNIVRYKPHIREKYKRVDGVQRHSLIGITVEGYGPGDDDGPPLPKKPTTIEGY